MGPFFGTLIPKPGSPYCIRVRLCFILGTPRSLTTVQKNGPKNGLRLDPKIDHFGVHFRGTKMGQFSDLRNGIIVSRWGVLKVKQSRTRMQGRDPGLEMKVPKKGPQNGPQFRGTKPMKNICIC